MPDNFFPLNYGMTLREVVFNYRNFFRAKLLADGIEELRIKYYDDAILSAVDYCEKQFSNEFGRFAGQFTSHGPDHAGRVLTRSHELAKLLSPPITTSELYILGLSAILHDIGMTAPLPKSFLTNSPNADEMWNERRRRHGEATAELLFSCKEPELIIISRANPQLYNTFLPHVCAAHCTSGFRTHVNAIRELTKRGHDKGRYSTLAGILLLADELDITSIRAMPDRAHYGEFRNVLTKAHWWKHWLVSDVELDGGIIRVFCLKDAVIYGAEEFALWTIGKLQQQINLLRDVLDPNGNDPLWRFDLVIKPVETVWWIGDLPELEPDVLAVAHESRLKIPGQRMGRVLEPRRLIEGEATADSIAPPSMFFRDLIIPNISILRGQGQDVELDQAWSLYVENKRNVDLLNHMINEWLHFTETYSIKLKILVGDIGVGKTHFLSTFLYEISKHYPDIAKKTIFVRAELTNIDSTFLLYSQRHVALTLYSELRKKGLLQPLREIMKSNFSKKTPIPIPKYGEEIEAWDQNQIDTFIRIVGMTCNQQSQLHRDLGVLAPNNLCVFLDNTDQFKNTIIAELYAWCFNILTLPNVMFYLFIRPETLSFQIREKAAFIDLRGPEPIYSVPLREVLLKRISYIRQYRTGNYSFKISSAPYVLTIDLDIIQDVLKKIVEMYVLVANNMVIQASDENSEYVHHNLRIGLQGFIGILGSHLMSDDFLSRLFLSRKKNNELFNDSVIQKEIKQRILESFILGRRLWFSSRYGAFENLFNPPELQENGDYFLLLHCLQVLDNFNGSCTLRELCARLNRINYSRGRVYSAVRHLTERTSLIDDSNAYDDLYASRKFPLIMVCDDSVDNSWVDSTMLQITQWGHYHINDLLYEFSYWKHIHYDIVLPRTFLKNLDIRVIRKGDEVLQKQLLKVIEYLSVIESSIIHGIEPSKYNMIGIKPVMRDVQVKVLIQKVE